jgi:hypothetical protein
VPSKNCGVTHKFNGSDRLIEYKTKMSEQWMADKVKLKKEESYDDEEEEPKLEIKKKKK